LTTTSLTYNYVVMKARRGKVHTPSRTMTPQALEMVAARFRAMGEPLRLRILQALENGEMSVSALTHLIGSTQPNISKHLKVLQDAGLLQRRQEGNVAFYSISDPMVFELCEMVCSRLRDRLEAQVGALNGLVRAGAGR
jgi:DNA-binding transcriptional ArsR family regulator